MDGEMIPALQDVLWPMFVKECQKEMEPVLKEMWGKLPKFRLLFLWLYESLPGVENVHVRKKMEEYLKTEAVPVLKKYQKQLEEIPVRVAREAGKEERLKSAMRQSFLKLFQDREMLDLFKRLVVEVYRRNEPVIKAQVQKKWFTPEFKQKLGEMSAELDPYLMRMVNRIALDKEQDEISPGLAEVLRRQVFFKNRYYLFTSSGAQRTGSHKTRFAGNFR